MKKVFTFFVLIFVSSLAFPLEFRLEYEQRLDSDFTMSQLNGSGLYGLHAVTDAFFLTDTTIVFTAILFSGQRDLFLLDYVNNKLIHKSVPFIDDLSHVYGTVNSHECILILYDDSLLMNKSNTNPERKYVLFNVDTGASKELSNEELDQLTVFTNQFDYYSPFSVFGKYQIYCHTDSEIEKIPDIDSWLLKISLINKNTVRIIKSSRKINECIQTLKNKKGEDLIIDEYVSSITFDSDNEKLVVFSTFGLDSYEEADFSYPTFYIYKLIYDATCNDTRVRIREEPNLSCSTLGYLNAGDAVKVTDKSDAPFEIDGESWYWYKVESDTLPDGWVYGKYLDIEK